MNCKAYSLCLMNEFKNNWLFYSSELSSIDSIANATFSNASKRLKWINS